MMTTTATVRSDAYLQSLQALLARVDAQTVPSGILVTAPASLRAIERPSGAALSQREWEQCYHDLHRGIVAGSDLGDHLPALADLRAKAAAHAPDAVPIALFDLTYHRPATPLVAAVAAAWHNDLPIAVGGDPAEQVEERHAFAASALLPDRCAGFAVRPPAHDGLQLRFVLDPELGTSNTGRPVASVEADFDDGLGLRPLTPAEPVPVIYDEAGVKRVRLVEGGDGGREASFIVTVDDPPPPPPWDERIRINAKIPFGGKTNHGYAYVLFGTTDGVKRDRLTNPIIISEGFPGGYQWADIYAALNTSDALTSLLSVGYDVVVLTYGEPGAFGGTDYIQRNAFVVVQCIQEIIDQRDGDTPLVVGGASMGGVITRYALTYMEHQSLPHETRLFFSFDSPQQGANAPIGAQWLAQVLKGLSSQASLLVGLLTSPAAQQMLILWVPDATYEGSLTSALHKAFYGELAELGYPHGYEGRPLHTVGIADGAGNGVQKIADLANVIDVPGIEYVSCAYGDLWAETDGAGTFGAFAGYAIDSYFESAGISFSAKNVVNYDGAPGGTSPVFRTLADGLTAAYLGPVTCPYDSNCFVPTISSLDLTASTPYEPVPKHGAPTKFDAYFVSDDDNEHIFITPAIRDFLLQQLGPPEQP